MSRAPFVVDESTRPIDQAAIRLNRRQFALGSLAGGVTALVGLGLVGYEAYAVAPFEPVLERIELSVPAGHEGLDGLTIGFIADSHLGPSMHESDVARAAALISAASPQLMLLGGDYVSASSRFAGPAAELFRPLVESTPLGVLAVLGNHDAGEIGRDAVVTTALEEAGITVLRNRAQAVDTGRGQLWIAGTDDAIMGHPDPDRTFAGIPRGAAILSLWHEPDFAIQAARRGAFAQLSGHSHGGQVRLPGIGPLFLPEGGQRYPMGFYSPGGMPLYTSRGAGVFLPPLRINCPPEVTLVTLVAR